MQKISGLFYNALFEIVEAFQAYQANHKRNEVKRLILEEPALKERLAVATEIFMKLKGTAPTYDPSFQKNRRVRKQTAQARTDLEKAKHKLEQFQRRMLSLKRSLRGELDETTEASWRSVTEWLGDTFARLIPTIATDRIADLTDLAHGISDRIATVETERETHKTVAQKVVAERFGHVILGTRNPSFKPASREYFKADRELVHLTAELQKTLGRIATLSRELIAA